MGLEIIKYPRTHHIEGSRLQPGDEDLESVPFGEIANRYLVVEEKTDGSNCGMSFTPGGELMLQSRGHYLTGGVREKHFALFKSWAHTFVNELKEALQDRFIMYGEWLYAKHTVFYNRLPHYFIEFDIYDKVKKEFLSTETRRVMLEIIPFITMVPVLFEGKIKSLMELKSLIGQSHFIKGNHLNDLRKKCLELDLDGDRVIRETDPSNHMEGLYIKVEEGGMVKERYKFVRAQFLATVLDSESHWIQRPVVPNQLIHGTDLFSFQSQKVLC